MTSLGPSGIPVPKTIGLCTDEAVNERPFFVMEFVEGHIVRDAPEAEEAFDAATRRAVGGHMATTLAALHDIDPDAVGLGDLGRREGYIERQLKRWSGQYAQMRVEGVDHGGLVERVGDELARRVPTQQRTSIVHGDYRLDNVVLDDRGEVRAILDWELCTLGDPLADVGLLMVYWAETATTAVSALAFSPTTAPGFSTRAQVLEQYAEASDLDLSGIGYYTSFGYWKLACILQGVYARYVAGAGAGDQGSVDAYPAQVGRPGPEGGRRTGGGTVSPDGITEIFATHGEPALDRPVLVVSLEGWVDAGLGRHHRHRLPCWGRAPRRHSSPSTASTSWTSGPAGRWPTSSTA